MYNLTLLDYPLDIINLIFNNLNSGGISKLRLLNRKYNTSNILTKWFDYKYEGKITKSTHE